MTDKPCLGLQQHKCDNDGHAPWCAECLGPTCPDCKLEVPKDG